jgi:hypothetical protein
VNLRLAAPAIFLAGLLLLPFLNKPFTIDDPLFLREAHHALVDPLHPADFEQVWNAGDRQRLSQYLLGGTLPAYVLMPVAALGSKEWIAHGYQFLLLCAFLVGTVSVARRLGCDSRQAGSVALLVATNPVTLAMAATCMPDIMAIAFGMWGLDRILDFRERERWGVALAAATLLAAAALCRATTLPLLLVAALWVYRPGWKLLWPIALAAALIVIVTVLTRGPAVGGAFALLTSLGNVPRNLIAFLAYQALTGPILLYALLSEGKRFAAIVLGLAAVGIALSTVAASPNLTQYAVPAALALCFLYACTQVASDWRAQSSLSVWLFAGLVAVPYVYMAAKYLLPGIPAAALLIVLHASQVQQQRFPLALAILIAAGWIAGALIVVGDTTLATSQRVAVDRLIKPRLRRGVHVWAGGQWAFLAYAEDAGASALGNTPLFPRPGDVIVISRLDYYGALDRMPIRKELLNTESDRRCGVFLLNRAIHAGFYSNRFGYLPFAIGCAELNAYDLYRVLP